MHASLSWSLKITSKLFYCVTSIVLRPGTHLHQLLQRTASFLAFAAADPGPVFSWCGGSLPSSRAHPSHSLCPQPQLAEKASGSLQASFLEASWSHSNESVSCTSSPLLSLIPSSLRNAGLKNISVNGRLNLLLFCLSCKDNNVPGFKKVLT